MCQYRPCVAVKQINSVDIWMKCNASLHAFVTVSGENSFHNGSVL